LIVPLGGKEPLHRVVHTLTSLEKEICLIFSWRSISLRTKQEVGESTKQ